MTLNRGTINGQLELGNKESVVGSLMDPEPARRLHTISSEACRLHSRVVCQHTMLKVRKLKLKCIYISCTLKPTDKCCVTQNSLYRTEDQVRSRRFEGRVNSWSHGSNTFRNTGDRGLKTRTICNQEKKKKNYLHGRPARLFHWSSLVTKTLFSF